MTNKELLIKQSQEIKDLDRLMGKQNNSINLLHSDLIDAKMERDILKEKVISMIINEASLKNEIKLLKVWNYNS